MGNIRNLILFATLAFVSETFGQEKNFFTGIGYIQPQRYRTDNEVNPLPFGLSVFPVIGYQSKRLRVLGPFISYALLQGAIGANLTLRTAGDNYEAYEVERRRVGVNAGASLRLYFLTLGYGADISNRNKGNGYSISLGHRFVLFEKLMIIPSIALQYQNSNFTNYYYGVRPDEAGKFSQYSLGSAVNEIYSLNSIYKFNDIKSLSLNLTRKKFDSDIAKSPTIALSSYSTLSVFLNYKF